MPDWLNATRALALVEVAAEDAAAQIASGNEAGPWFGSARLIMPGSFPSSAARTGCDP